MRKLIAILMLTVSMQLAAADTIGLDDPNIRYTGRWLTTNASQPQTSWAGTQLQFSFTGTTAAIELDTGKKAEQFRVIVNGEPNPLPITIKPGRQWVELAKNLTKDTHHIALFKETLYGERTTFYRLKADGALQPLPPKPSKRIAFFGDSNMDGTSMYSDEDSGHTGTYYAYPSVVSRMLNAEPSIQAMGGATLGGKGNNAVTQFIYSPDFYSQNTDYRDNFKPDVIVVNAGANDIGRVDKKGVKTHYRQVVSELRNVYGDQPHIVLFNAYAWDFNEPANYSHEIVDEIGGNLSVALFPWVWEKWHGSMVEHAGQARILANHILSLNLGFKQVAEAEVFSRYSGNFDVVNGSFEHIATGGFMGFGWRYVNQGVERINGDAAHGEFYIRLDKGEQVHQGNDATGDLMPGGTQGKQRYRISAMIRSTNDGVVNIGARFQDQGLYSPKPVQLKTFSANDHWQPVSTTVVAPEGSWKIETVLQATQGTVDIDNIQVETIDYNVADDLQPMQQISFQYGEYQRDAFLFIPEGHDKPLPLVVAIHGYTSTATGFQLAHGLNRHATDNGYAILYPQGMHFKASWGGRVTSWNDEAANFATDTGPDRHCAADKDPYPMPPDCKQMGPCGWTSCQDDVGYIEALLDKIQTRPEIDASKTYALGVSNGGMMVLRLGCNLSERFAAIAPIIGQLAPQFDCTPSTSLPMIHLAGALDTTVTVDGSQTADGFFYNSVAETTQTWATALSCNMNEKPWPNLLAANGDMQCTQYTQCGDKGSAVTSCIAPKEAHNWPAQGYLGAPATCVTQQQTSAMPESPLCTIPKGQYRSAGMDTIWGFFKQYKVGE